jgi:uncharacterized protein YbjT (DUF2867 family)
MILVTGASGTVGAAVLGVVRARGLPHRALYRSAAEAAKAPAGTDAVIADFADSTTLSAAFEGIDSLYLVCSPIPELVKLESNVIAASVEAGVRRIVLNSALGAGDFDKSFPVWHRAVEGRLRATPLGWSILRPNSFTQNLVTYFAPTIRSDGVFYGALGDARTCYLDVRDIAAVAASCLAGGHDGKVYELNGPEGLSSHDVAVKIAAHAGRPVQYVDIPAAALRQAMLDQGMPVWQATAITELQEYYTGGKGGTPDDTLAGLLGHAPRTVDQFLDENAAQFRGA